MMLSLHEDLPVMTVGEAITGHVRDMKLASERGLIPLIKRLRSDVRFNANGTCISLGDAKELAEMWINKNQPTASYADILDQIIANLP